VVALVVVVLDQVTKALVLRVLTPGRFVPLLGEHIGWQLVGNRGAAFGIPLPTFVFPIVTVVVIVMVVKGLPDLFSPVLVGSQGLVVGGAIGNVIDRISRAEVGLLDGEVVDFVAWGSFPRFNVADAAITVGVVVLVLAMLREDRRERASGGQDAPTDER
jgi:signal peptidase II